MRDEVRRFSRRLPPSTSPGLCQQSTVFRLQTCVANLLNETLLELTALSDEDENLIGDELDKQISKDLRFTRERKFDINKIFNKLMKYDILHILKSIFIIISFFQTHTSITISIRKTYLPE